MESIWATIFRVETHKTAYDGFKDVDGANNDSNTGFRKNLIYLKFVTLVIIISRTF